MRTLTDAQRQQLSLNMEWLALQKSMYDVYSYLSFTKLEDIKMQGLIDALEQISMRREAILERFLHHNQGGG